MSYYNTGDTYTTRKAQSDSPDLPGITFTTSDENGKAVIMTLAPEGGISSSDVMRIMMLTIASMHGGHEFNALAYVKKQNLERHFTYS